MMFGGGLMMAIGLLFMLMVVIIPILLIFVLLGGAFGLWQKQYQSADVIQRPVYSTSNPVVQSNQMGVAYTHYCQHCSAGLQADWTHCPQCGAPIS